MVNLLSPLIDERRTEFDTVRSTRLRRSLPLVLSRFLSQVPVDTNTFVIVLVYLIPLSRARDR
jgi:hypothetical protein